MKFQKIKKLNVFFPWKKMEIQDIDHIMNSDDSDSDISEGGTRFLRTTHAIPLTYSTKMQEYVNGNKNIELSYKEIDYLLNYLIKNSINNDLILEILNTHIPYDTQPLKFACISNNNIIIKKLLELGLDANDCDSLQICAANNNVEGLKLITSFGYKYYISDALIQSIILNNIEIVKYILSIEKISKHFLPVCLSYSSSEEINELLKNNRDLEL